MSDDEKTTRKPKKLPEPASPGAELVATRLPGGGTMSGCTGECGLPQRENMRPADHRAVDREE